MSVLKYAGQIFRAFLRLQNFQKLDTTPQDPSIGATNIRSKEMRILVDKRGCHQR